tara:strand:+ start:2227 stop:3396 length:1170 start_codon:yes stop_codon:yes gene_type:complete
MTEHTIGAQEPDEGTEFTYDLYRLRRVNPDLGGRKFQDVYGRGDLPNFQWVEAIKSGTRKYDPTNTEDRKRLEEYGKKYIQEGGAASGMLSPQELIGEIAPVAGMVGESVGESLFTGGSIGEGFRDLYSTTAGDITPAQTLFSDLTSAKAARAAGLSDEFSQLAKAGMRGGVIDTANIPSGLDAGALGGVEGRNLILEADRGDLLNPMTDAGAQNLKGALGGAVGNFAVQLALGQDPVKAAKSAGAGAIGKVIGNAILPGLGGFIGGALGGIIGGRVICNELMKQGLMSKEEVILDYRFTRDYLTPQHVNGYHLWAVWVVKQMRKGRMVKLWKYIAQSRANEIAYIYGKREKPDYAGKAIRMIGEPVCWFLGLFCKKTDWSTLYKEKEI